MNKIFSKKETIQIEDKSHSTIIEESETFKKIQKTNQFIQKLQKLNLNEYLNIPCICSIGTQSIIGLDILPKGEGIVTRRPLELRLTHLETQEPYVILEEYNDKNKKEKITDLSKIKEIIIKFQDKVCGNNKNIEDKPLIINIFSKTCPDLTIIDLPGISKVPIGEQPKNIEEITKNLTAKYISNPNTIILCCIAANQDMTTSDGLYLSKEIDYYGERTIGVLTKIDLMDEGTDCQNILLNKEIPLKLGYIAVKNRSELDLKNGISINEGIKKEEDFFKNHTIYNKMNKNLLGTKSLIRRLNEVYNKLFFKNIRNIIDSINQHIRRVNKEIDLLGEPVPDNLKEKNKMFLKLIQNYIDIFFNILNNKEKFIKNQDSIKNIEKKENKINKLYSLFLKDYINIKFNENIIQNLSTQEKENSIIKILRPYLKKIKEESSQLYDSIKSYLFNLSDKVIITVFKRFNLIKNKMKDIIKNIFEKEMKNTEDFMNKILDSELNYQFTNDKEFVSKYENYNYFKRFIRFRKLFKIKRRIN